MFSVVLETAGNQTITASDTTGSISPGPARRLPFSSRARPFRGQRRPAHTAGNTVTLTVAAKDVYGNTIPAYAGTVSFSSNNPQPRCPAAPP